MCPEFGMSLGVFFYHTLGRANSSDLLVSLFFMFSRIVLYAIAMAEYDQENGDVCKSVLKTKDGIDRLALYHSSVGRLLSPFLCTYNIHVEIMKIPLPSFLQYIKHPECTLSICT